MKSLNPNLYPKGGYYFINIDGARIFGDSWKGVEARTVNYRKRAGQTIGNVWEEIVLQVCAREPVLCVESDAVYSATLKKTNLKTRVLGWFLRIREKRDHEGLNFVSDKTRNDRVNICAGCPKNQALPGGCASCRQAVEESQKDLIGSRAIDPRLNACDVLSEDLTTATWIEQVADENPDLPGHCWRKKTLG